MQWCFGQKFGFFWENLLKYSMPVMYCSMQSGTMPNGLAWLKLGLFAVEITPVAKNIWFPSTFVGTFRPRGLGWVLVHTAPEPVLPLQLRTDLKLRSETYSEGANFLIQ